MNDNAPEMLAILPDPKLFRAARSIQRICLILTGIGILFGVLPLLGLGGSAAVSRGAMPLIVTSLLCALSLVLSGTETDSVAFSFAVRVADLLAIFAAGVVV